MTLEGFEAECAKFGLVGVVTSEPCWRELQLRGQGFMVARYVGAAPGWYGPVPWGLWREKSNTWEFSTSLREAVEATRARCLEDLRGIQRELSTLLLP